MKKRVADHWALFAALSMLWLTMLILCTSVAAITHGFCSYALDDAYIHMAIAKNLAEHGVYGVTPYQFGSSSSSPLWTILLAIIYRIIGVRSWVPFLLNFLCASGLLVLFYSYLRRVAANQFFILATLAGIIFFTPLPLMILIGMEHLLHLLLAVLFLWMLAAVVIKNDTSIFSYEFGMLCVLAMMVTFCRFESYSMVGTGCLLFLLRGRWRRSLALGCVSIILPAILQYIAVLHGGFWVPNSIMIRTPVTTLQILNSQQAIVFEPDSVSSLDFFSNFLTNSTNAPCLLLLLRASCIVLCFRFVQTKSLWHTDNVLLLLYSSAALLHLQFGLCGFLHRYEAYLIALGLFILAYSLTEIFSGDWRTQFGISKTTVLGITAAAFIYFGTFPFLIRCTDGMRRGPRACRNIYEQQVQMAVFLQQFYPNGRVAINDIGAIAYLTDVHILDLVGLASADVVTMQKAGLYNPASIQTLCEKENIQIAVVYDSWLNTPEMGGVPSSWIKTGTWTIPVNAVCASDIVSFYAVHPPEEKRLRENLQAFSGLLPDGVKQEGAYTTCASLHVPPMGK